MKMTKRAMLLLANKQTFAHLLQASEPYNGDEGSNRNQDSLQAVSFYSDSAFILNMKIRHNAISRWLYVLCSKLKENSSCKALADGIIAWHYNGISFRYNVPIVFVMNVNISEIYF